MPDRGSTGVVWGNELLVRGCDPKTLGRTIGSEVDLKRSSNSIRRSDHSSRILRFETPWWWKNRRGLMLEPICMVKTRSELRSDLSVLSNLEHNLLLQNLSDLRACDFWNTLRDLSFPTSRNSQSNSGKRQFGGITSPTSSSKISLTVPRNTGSHIEQASRHRKGLQ